MRSLFFREHMFGETHVCLWASKDNIYEMVFHLPPYGFSQVWRRVRGGVWVRALHASHVDVGGHFAGITSFNHGSHMGPEDRTPGSHA